jgi:hypothetical protein
VRNFSRDRVPAPELSGMRRGAGDLADPRELASRKWKKSRFWRFFFKIIGFHPVFACLRHQIGHLVGWG